MKSYIEQDFDGIVQFVCDCGAHFILKAYDSKHCPKCEKDWVYDFDIKDVVENASTIGNTFQSIDQRSKAIHKDRATNKRYYQRI